MKKPLASFTALALAASISVGAFTPAQAAPLRLAPLASDGAPVVDVQYRRLDRRIRRQERRLRRDRALRRDIRRTNRRLRRQRGTALAGGIIGGLALGAIIGSANRGYAEPRYVAPRPVYRAQRYSFPPAHHGWCSDRYRSYRASDGTFQPYHGPRKLCRSPYL